MVAHVPLLRRRARDFSHLPPPPAATAGRFPTMPGVTGGYLAPFTVPDVAWWTSREALWRIPAVANGLQIISGTIGSLPLRRVDADYRDVPPGLFAQIDPDEPSPHTLTRVVEDLVLFPAAYLVVIARYADGYPSHLRYVPAEDVTEPGRGAGFDAHYRIAGVERPVPAREVVRIPSPWPGLIACGSATLRTASVLEYAASRLAAHDVPTGILHNRGADLSPDKVDELLAGWEAGRAKRLTGYLNAAIDYEQVQFDANQLGVAAGRDHYVAEVARLLNLPPSDLNAPTSDSLTYSTTEGQRLDRLTRLRPYLVAVESRFSMGDLTPRGQLVRFDTTDYLRTDTTAAMNAYATALAAGILTVPEVRAQLHLPPLGGAPSTPTSTPALEPASAPALEESTQ
jgi:hypothetical protein